jgi:hypothetical protein
MLSSSGCLSPGPNMTLKARYWLLGNRSRSGRPVSTLTHVCILHCVGSVCGYVRLRSCERPAAGMSLRCTQMSISIIRMHAGLPGVAMRAVRTRNDERWANAMIEGEMSDRMTKRKDDCRRHLTVLPLPRLTRHGKLPIYT